MHNTNPPLGIIHVFHFICALCRLSGYHYVCVCTRNRFKFKFDHHLNLIKPLYNTREDFSSVRCCFYLNQSINQSTNKSGKTFEIQKSHCEIKNIAMTKCENSLLYNTVVLCITLNMFYMLSSMSIWYIVLLFKSTKKHLPLF